jgi:Flp pilus assembly pilin Flp
MMNSRSVHRLVRRLRAESGVTLIETTVACALMVVVLAGVAGMTTLATRLTENEGHLTTRTAEYAVDKMEQLQELTYGDAQSNTTVFPSTTSGGTGLAVGGSERAGGQLHGLPGHGRQSAVHDGESVHGHSAIDVVLPSRLAGLLVGYDEHNRLPGEHAGQHEANQSHCDDQDRRRRRAEGAVERGVVQDQLSGGLLTSCDAFRTLDGFSTTGAASRCPSC